MVSYIVSNDKEPARSTKRESDHGTKNAQDEVTSHNTSKYTQPRPI